MLKLVNKRLPRTATVKLAEYQKSVNEAGGYSDQVDKAKRAFKQRNRKTNAAFKKVKEKLLEMCNGSRRCMYCEDSVADEVEHFQPKDLYPEVVFAWKNYFYACGPCNGPKNSKFSVINSATVLVDVTRKVRAPITPPAKGKMALIDPRRENPLDFMMLDLRDTFEFTSITTDGSEDDLRATYTIYILRLNERDYLVDARRNALGGFRARLKEYVDARNSGGSRSDLRLLREGIRRAPHPTVWAEMVRQRNHYPKIKVLFDAAPEAVAF